MRETMAKIDQLMMEKSLAGFVLIALAEIV